MKSNNKQLFRLFGAIAAGIAFGAISPDWGIRVTNSFRELFGAFMRFFVPFIVLGLVSASIASFRRGAGQTLFTTLAFAAISTISAGFLAFFSTQTATPFLLAGNTTLPSANPATALMPLFTLDIPPMLDVKTALLTAILFGLGISATSANRLRDAAVESKGIILEILRKAVVPTLPIYVFTVVANLTANGQLVALGGGCSRIMVVAASLSICMLVLQYTVAGIVTGRNPAKSILTMLPAYLAGCGSCSSVATVPLTIRQTRENGVAGDTAELVVPLCSSIHHVGGVCNMIVFTSGLMILSGGIPSFAAFAKFILLLSVVSFASPGVPGGLALACASIAESALGFTPDRYAVVVALYLAMDSLGTACNLSCDGALAMIVDGIRRRGPFIVRKPVLAPIPA